MADQTVIAEDKKEDPNAYTAEDRNKTFSQILKEQAAAKPTEDTPTETPATESVPTEEEKAAKEVEAKKQEEEKQEAARKHDAELAAKAAQDVIDKQKAEEQTKLDKAKAEEEEKAKQEALKPKFTGVDDKGNPVPKDYDEMAAEAARIAEEKAYARLQAEQTAKEAKTTEETEAQKARDAQVEEQKKAYNEQLQKTIDNSLTAIYKAGDLPKIKIEIKDPNDPLDPGFKDEGYLAREHFFKTAQQVNAARIAKGEPLISDPQIIRYGKDPETGKSYYKPLAKPADVPVMGNESTISNDLPDDKYIPARDRNKPWGQLIKEEAQKAARRLQVRGN